MNRRPPREIPLLNEAEANINRGLELNSHAKNYQEWIYELISPYLSGSILEIGAGRGDFTWRFATHGSLTATEISETLLEHLRIRFRTDDNVQISGPEALDSCEKYDSIVLVNVLEHIQNDEETLRKLFMLLRPGGVLILYVPAFWFLYSDYDSQIGHYRRYRSKELQTLCSHVGLEVLDSRYINAIGGLGWWLVCRIFRRPASQPVSVDLMDRLVIPISKAVESVISVPFGVSLFCVCRKSSK